MVPDVDVDVDCIDGLFARLVGCNELDCGGGDSIIGADSFAGDSGVEGCTDGMERADGMTGGASRLWWWMDQSVRFCAGGVGGEGCGLEKVMHKGNEVGKNRYKLFF